MVWAARGAVAPVENEAGAIRSATRALAHRLAEENGWPDRQRPVFAFVTATPDLSEAFPATGVREALGIPVMGAQEVEVPWAPPRCCRVMVVYEGDTAPVNLYLGDAERLVRP